MCRIVLNLKVKVTGICLTLYLLKACVMNGSQEFTLNFVKKNKIRSLNIFDGCWEESR